MYRQGPVLLAALIAGFISIAATGQNQSAVITVYHHVATNTPPSTSISPENFRRHLQYLRDNGFTVLDLPAMIQALRNGEEIPDRSAVITFDDGYESIFSTAFPLLTEFDMPFTLFVSTEPINNSQPGYMTWNQIREMSNAGVTIANHMVTHSHMLERSAGETENDWLERLRNELLAAEATILEETGQSHRFLAYPYGEFNPQIKELLQDTGFTGFAQNSGAVGSASDFLALPRFPLASIYANLDTASTKLNSLAFATQIVSPQSPVTADTSPEITLRFAAGNYKQDSVNCFANSQAIPIDWQDRDAGILHLEPDMEFSGRRWGYICTARAMGSDRYYWYSVPWFNPAVPE